MHIRIMNDFLLVRLDGDVMQVESKLLEIPDIMKKRAQTGIVVGIGKDCHGIVKEGDRVRFRRTHYRQSYIENTVDYRFVKESELQAVIE